MCDAPPPGWSAIWTQIGNVSRFCPNRNRIPSFPAPAFLLPRGPAGALAQFAGI
jgi:hypothetical protein